MIGSRFGKYRIAERLGEGGMGSVWRAQDTLLGRDIALKFLAERLASQVEARQRFLREARAASRLEHPGIASVHDAGELEGRVFIAYQFVPGVTLRKRLCGGPTEPHAHEQAKSPNPQPLALDELLRFATGTAEALAHAHERGVLHRDLTAGNIMLRTDGEPVIVDFGLARGQDDTTLTRTGATLGTAGYMSPEQWRGEPGDARSDLWSLGVVLYEAATGTMPFDGETPEATMYGVLNEEAVQLSKLRPDVRPEFERLVHRLIEKDPRDRIQDANSLASALRAISNETREQTSAREGESPLAAIRRGWRRWGRRAGTLKLVLAALVLAFAGTGGYLAWQRLTVVREPVLAVLPMRNTSPDAEESQYIAEALGSELTARLGNVGGLRVLPWETTSRYTPSAQPLTRVARELGADLLLVGHFAGEGERIEVGVELVEGRRGLQTWSERFRREERNLADLQSDIAERIAERLLSKQDRSSAARARLRTPMDPEAYKLFLQGAEAMHSLDDLTRRTAEPLFRAALERDSTLSQAWVGLGAVLLNRYYEGDFGGLSGLHEAREYFQRGLNLDPTSGPAIRGLVRAYSEAGPIRAGVALVDSLGPLIPNEIERELARGWACAVIGLPDEAVQAMDRVLEVDPRNRGARFYRTFLLWWAGRLSESAEASKSYIRDFGEDADVYAYCGVALAAMTRYDEAIVLLQRSVELFGGNGGAFALIYLAGALHSAGRHSEADSTLAHSLPVYEARLAASPDNMRLRLNLLALYASAKRVHRYDETWKETRRQLQSETSAYPSDVLYVYFALAQVGELERARAVVRFFGAVDADASLLAHAGAAPERIWNGNFTNEFLRSLEFVQLRTGIPAFRERIRSQFAWVAGAAEPANQKSRRGVALGSTR